MGKEIPVGVNQQFSARSNRNGEVSYTVWNQGGATEGTDRDVTFVFEDGRRIQAGDQPVSGGPTSTMRTDWTGHGLFLQQNGFVDDIRQVRDWSGFTSQKSSESTK